MYLTDTYRQFIRTSWIHFQARRGNRDSKQTDRPCAFAWCLISWLLALLSGSEHEGNTFLQTASDLYRSIRCQIAEDSALLNLKPNSLRLSAENKEESTKQNFSQNTQSLGSDLNTEHLQILISCLDHLTQNLVKLSWIFKLRIPRKGVPSVTALLYFR